MKFLQSAAVALLFITSAMSASCAQAQEKPRPPAPPFGESPPPAPPEPPSSFGQDPPSPPRPPKQQDDRREKIERLENEIRELEGALKRDDVPDERRDHIKERLGERKRALKELLASGPGWQDDHRKAHHEKLRHIEAELEKLEMALQNKDARPEERKKLMGRMEELRAHRHELLSQMKATEQRQDPSHARPFGAPGMPPDPESHKMHMEAQELDRASMDLSHKLRGVPKENKDDRDAVLSKLKETVTRLFDVREKLRAREIELIKKRLDELNQLLEKRKVNRDAIIEKRLKQLSGEADELDW